MRVILSFFLVVIECTADKYMQYDLFLSARACTPAPNRALSLEFFVV